MSNERRINLLDSETTQGLSGDHNPGQKFVVGICGC